MQHRWGDAVLEGDEPHTWRVLKAFFFSNGSVSEVSFRKCAPVHTARAHHGALITGLNGCRQKHLKALDEMKIIKRTISYLDLKFLPGPGVLRRYASAQRLRTGDPRAGRWMYQDPKKRANHSQNQPKDNNCIQNGMSVKSVRCSPVVHAHPHNCCNEPY